MKRVLLVTIAAVAAAAACFAVWRPVEACVGKTIFLGKLPGKEQEMLAEIFVWMVSERTGTTIQTKSFPDSRTSHAALETADIDLYLEDQGVALHDILGRPAGAPDVREVVRREYEQRFNLIWLEPWGMTGQTGGAAAPPTLVAPVIRKDTLKKFPALSRLVNKMSGVVDDASMARLVQESASRPPRDVAKGFLKERKLI